MKAHAWVLVAVSSDQSVDFAGSTHMPSEDWIVLNVHRVLPTFWINVRGSEVHLTSFLFLTKQRNARSSFRSGFLRDMTRAATSFLLYMYADHSTHPKKSGFQTRFASRRGITFQLCIIFIHFFTVSFLATTENVEGKESWECCSYLSLSCSIIWARIVSAVTVEGQTNCFGDCYLCIQ